MKLKSLEIKGFKSFADKTHIILDNPITGIVGPNGCGKSNIIDAIRWVIGEHKIKSLRSDNLLDLIFNGSRSRSASGMAEVSLTFENTRNLLPTEFTTVTITRKFFRSGDSEYRLNDVACRLKDIHNLFLDTGVSNDSYAIIELGMVDDIIKDKDGARRRMLEQAAGISIYKTRKKEAKQKLDATQQDIERIDDLLFEISNNLRTLESQAKKAEKYLQLKKEYKTTAIELAKVSLADFNNAYQSLSTQIEQEQDRKIAIETAIVAEEAIIETNKVQLIQQEQTLGGMQRQFNELLGTIRNQESEKQLTIQRLAYLNEKEKNLQFTIQNAQFQIQQLDQQIRSNQRQIDTEEENIEDLRYQQEDLRADLEEQKDEYDQQKLQLQQLKNAYSEFQRVQFDAEKKVAVADTAVSNTQRNIQLLLAEIQQQQTLIAQLHIEREQITGKIVTLTDTITAQIKEQESIKANIQYTQQLLEITKNNLVTENRILDAKKNEHNLLQSLVDSLEGYPDSIKYLQKHPQWQYDAPLLSDVFVVQDTYRTAIEQVLDQYLNYYIVQDMSVALKAIQLLKEHKKGKANFFILEDIKINTGDTPPLPGLTPALSVVDIDSAYLPIAQLLLKHVYLSSNIKSVAHNTIPEGVTIIAQEGGMIYGKHSISGGSIGIFEGNKIGRAKNLERLANEIVAKKSITAELEEKVSAIMIDLKNDQQALQQINVEQHKNQLLQLQNQQNNILNKLEHTTNQITTNQNKIASNESQLTDTQQDISETRAQLEAYNHQLYTQQANINTAEAAFVAIEQTYNITLRQCNDIDLTLTKQQSKIEQLKQEFAFRTQQIKDITAQIQLNENERSEAKIQIEETNTIIINGDQLLYDKLQQKAQDERLLNEFDKAYYEFRNKISAQESLISKQRKDRERSDALLQQLKEQLNTMNVQVASIRERLSIEFRVDLDDILHEERTTHHSLENLNIETDRLKKRLEQMGEINPTAIEAYNEIKVRHDFIVEQKEDLEEAKKTLLATIEEVEQTANLKFKETFDQVRTNFVQVFKALFTENDNADLRLTDEANVAESGIEIYAQPKGKKPSTLTQLSGGEKTLTSTAFLFAIYLIKPAPFCILDEVDAPLDDANVSKFTQMIRKFSDKSQFIIVTHNKQTMAAVDVIYGVTMQEAGVSKIVPVDFRSLSN